MHERSIRSRLMRTFIAATGLALLLAASAFLLADLYKAREGLVEKLSVTARVIGGGVQNSLVYGYMADADKTLTTLEADPHVMAAVIFDDMGQPFASYRRQGVEALPELSSPDRSHAFASGRLDVVEPVVAAGERYGTVVIRSDTRDLRELLTIDLLILLAVAFGSLGIGYLGASLLRNRIADPLAALVDGSSRVAAGDLSAQVEIDDTADEELARLAEAFNAMSNSLRALVSQVADNSSAVARVSGTVLGAAEAMRAEAGRQETVAEGATEAVERIHTSLRDIGANVETLSQTATDTSSASLEMNSSIAEIAEHMDGLSESIDGTASSVVQMTSAIREIARAAGELNDETESTSAALVLLGQSVKEVEDNASQTHALSEQAVAQAAEGRRSVEQTERGIEEIRDSFQGLEEIIAGLNSKSEAIGEVVGVIESVVEQTNLLALNAAIISAQAGEHGRAFSVVAGEVGNLAQRTAGSTREISDLIDVVREGVSQAAAAMMRGGERVEKGVALSRKAAGILRRMGESAEQSSERVHEIVEAARRQARDIERVEQAMVQVKTIAEQLDRGTHEQDSSSSEIMRAVERMRDLGARVRRSTEEQRKESGLISHSVEVVAARIDEILASTHEQGKQGEQILEALGVFREITTESIRRGDELQEGLRELAERSQALEHEIGCFRV